MGIDADVEFPRNLICYAALYFHLINLDVKLRGIVVGGMK
jgi:hypothetical protein